MTSPALNDFGKAVRKSRTAKGWTLEMLAHEALGNQERKSYVSAVERGKKRLSALTVQKFARALDLSDDVVDPALHHAAPQDEPATQSETEADQLFDELASLRQKLKISESLAIALAVKHAEGNPSDLDGALRELERAFEVARDQAERGALPSNTDAAANAVIAEVDRLNEEEGLEAGSAYLNAELERMAAQHVRLIDKALAQAVMARDADAAVALVLQKLRLEGEGNLEALRTIRDTWYVRGRDKGLRFDLEVSIGLARQALTSARTHDERGNALNDLAISLQTLGERETGTERMKEAVTAYRAALEEYARERVPLGWAMTQNNMGIALLVFGQRATGTARLLEAVTAFRAALEERTRELVPLDWAATQNNLGNALGTLGERETGTERLDEAVAAYRAALEEYTRDRVPLYWALTQNNLGAALSTLGERETGTKRLEEAVAAYRAALEERTRDRVPLDWAMTQNNLGNALRTLGERETGTERLDEAVIAYRAALEEYTRDRVPLYWALTLNNLSNALLTLGERETGKVRLEEAVTAFRAALEERTRDRVPLNWATTQNNLGNALRTLGERETGTERLKEAVTAYRAALEERRRDRVPLDWAFTHFNLSFVELAFFDKTGDTAHLDQAEAYVTAARGVFEEAGATHYLAKADDLLTKITRRRQSL